MLKNIRKSHKGYTADAPADQGISFTALTIAMTGSPNHDRYTVYSVAQNPEAYPGP